MKWMPVLLLMLGSAGVAHAQPSERSFRYDLALDIDAQGHVAHVGLPDGVPAPFVAPLERAANSWAFKAPLRDGVPVTARTYARVRLLLMPQGKEQYGVRMTSCRTGRVSPLPATRATHPRRSATARKARSTCRPWSSQTGA